MIERCIQWLQWLINGDAQEIANEIRTVYLPLFPDVVVIVKDGDPAVTARIEHANGSPIITLWSMLGRGLINAAKQDVRARLTGPFWEGRAGMSEPRRRIE